jgi:CheY-like chemotaxis protein
VPKNASSKSEDPKQLILWAEDDENDALLFQRALESVSSSCSMHRVQDGEQVIDYLKGEGEYADRSKYPLPHLLLLDIKMTGKGGFDVLEWKRSQPRLDKIPAVMLSSSLEDRDKAKAESLGASGYFAKPTESAKIKLVMKSLTEIVVRDVPCGQ